MYLLSLVIFIFSLVTIRSDSEEEKYIDLLPEEEKRAFLEKVARRLIDGIRTKDSRYKSSEEISNEELNRHSDFVRHVLQEESDNLRRNTEGKNNNDSNEMKVQGIDKTANDGGNRNHIDLTLRQGKRSKRNEISRNKRDNDYEMIPVQTKYDSGEDKKKSQEETYVNNITEVKVADKSIGSEDSAAEDIEVRGRRFKKVDDSPHVQRNVIPYYTKIDNFEPEIATESNQKESEEVKVETTTKYVGNDETVYKRVTASIPNDPVEEESDDNNSDDSNETTTDVTTNSNSPKVVSIDITTNSNVKDSVNVTTNSNNLDAVTAEMPTTITNITEITTEQNTNNASEGISTTPVTTRVKLVENLEPPKVKRRSMHENNDKLVKSNDKPTAVGENDDVPEVESNTNNDYVPGIKEETKQSDINNDDVSGVKAETKLSDDNDDDPEASAETNQSDNNTEPIKEGNKAITSNLPKESSTDVNNTDIISEKVEEKSDDLDSKERELSPVHHSENTVQSGDASLDKRGNKQNEYNNSVEKQTVSKSENISDTTENTLDRNDPEHKTVILSDDSSNTKQEDIDLESTTDNPIVSNKDELKGDTSPIESEHTKINSSDVNVFDTNKNILDNTTVSTSNDTDEVNANNSKFKYKTTLEAHNRDQKKNVSEKESVKFENSVNKTNMSSDNTNKNESITAAKKYEDEKLVITDVTTDKNTSEKYNEYVLTTTERSYTSPSLVSHLQNVSAAVKIEDDDTKNKNNDDEVNTKSDLVDVDFVSKIKGLKQILEVIKESVHKKEIARQANGGSSSNKKIKEYLVYEIPKDQTPFIQKESLEVAVAKNQDQPHYVPIYNYAPSHAYYNAYNRLGPNDEENQDDESVKIVYKKENFEDNFETNSEGDVFEDTGFRKFKFSGKKNDGKQFKRIAESPPALNFPLPLAANKPKFSEVYIKPDDYFDLDYYFGRSIRRPDFRARKKKKHNQCNPGECSTSASILQETEDDYHPYNLMKDERAKDHISAVRQMLYKKHYFGFVSDPPHTPAPKIESQTQHSGDQSFRAQNRTDVIILVPTKNLRNAFDKSRSDDISVDYYFGIDGNTDRKFIRSRKKSNDVKIDLNGVKNKTANTLRILGDIPRRHRTSKKMKVLHEQQKLEWMKNSGTIRDILAIGNEHDAFIHLEKMRQMNMTYLRTKVDENKDVEVFVDVLRDMIEMDNEALVKYDWLGTAVDILSVLQKLQYLTNSKIRRERIYSSDSKILNYVVHLYKSARSSLKDSKEARIYQKTTGRKKGILPRNFHKPKEYLTAKGLINREWLFRERLSDDDDLSDLRDFGEFLEDLESSLHDLHEALKHIAMVTKYKKQNWYANLKDTYMKKPEKKYLLEVLIHVFTGRLVGLLEDSAVNGIEDGFFQYVDRNKKHVGRSVDEMAFVMKLLTEYKNMDEKKEPCNSEKK